MKYLKLKEIKSNKIQSQPSMLSLFNKYDHFRCNGLSDCTVTVSPLQFPLTRDTRSQCDNTPLYLEVQFDCITNTNVNNNSMETETGGRLNMGANISKVWSHSDSESLLSPDIVEKAVRDGILNKNIPVTESYVDHLSYVDEDSNNEDLVMTSLNSPRLENVALETRQHNFQYQMFADSIDVTNDSLSHNDIDDNIDESDTEIEIGFTYREVLIIASSSSILIIITLLIAILGYIQKKRRKSLSPHRPDLIPMSGTSSSLESQYDISNTPDNEHPGDHITDFNNKFRYFITQNKRP